MEGAVYSLKGNNINSDLYYKDVSLVSKRVKKFIIDKGDMFLRDFMNYIKENDIESLRTKDEYAIELLMMGVMLSEYSLYINRLNKNLHRIFKYLNILRGKESLKDKVDIIKGRLISSVLYNKKNESISYNIDDLVLWMSESGDFKEEVCRLKTWADFFKGKSEEYTNSFIAKTISAAKGMEDICDEYLKVYINSLAEFLGSSVETYKNREDFIYCTKGRKQYYFNMVSAQIMNEVYRREFLKCRVKKIFAPACMRQTQNKCRAVKGDFGYECRKCSAFCNINRLTKLVEDKNIKVHTIPHETVIDNLDVEKKGEVGIIGIACLTNLISGGWKALRLGFIPQCVILDYCGCEKHWLDKGLMTSINSSYLIDLING